MRLFRAAVLGFVALVLAYYLIVAFLIFTAPGVRAHTAAMGWAYDGNCCNGDAKEGDCQSIPDTAVKPIPGGYRVTLLPGDHRLVTTPHTWDVKTGEVLWSQDEDYHACLWPNEATLRCFYAVPMGF